MAAVRSGGDARDKRFAEELASAARTHRASVERTLAEIENNLANRDPYRAFEQYKALERLLGDGDERVKELAARFEEKKNKWLTDEGRKYYEAWDDVRTVAFMNWIPYGLQAKRLVGRPPELRPRFWEDLVPTSEESPVTWKVHRWGSLGKAKDDAEPDAPPPSGWEAPGFDDSAWPEAKAPLGPAKGGEATWETRSIALRKSLAMENTDSSRLRLLVKSPRESVTDAYINGVRVASVVLGPKRQHAKIELDDRARSLLKRGANLLAVRCTHASTRPQSIDVGLQWCARQTRGPVASRRGRVVPMPDAPPSAPPARRELIIRRPKERYLEELEQSYDAKSVDELVTGLTDVIPYHRRLAAGALARKGEDAVPRVVETLTSPNWHVRRGGCDALAEIARLHRGRRRGGESEPDDATKEARTAAYRAAVEAVPHLMKLLRDEELWVRHGAASALAGMEEGAAASAEALVSAAADGDKWVREAVIGAVQKVTKEKDVHLRAATNVLRQPDVSFAVTRHAVSILTRHGKEYREAVPALKYFVANPGEGMWACVAPAMELLVELDADSAGIAPLLADVVRGGPRYYRLRGGPREKVAELLGKMGAKAKSALPVLKEVVKGDDERETALREAAAKAVELIEKE
ncbi:MAG: HEAT repeat domain-containing protein [Planctomycetota bacterium]|jgi:HEAT repeat protein